MGTNLTTIGALLPSGWDVSKIPGFVPVARYYESMDSVLYLREDVPYRADRIDAYLTLLWHPQEDRAVGLKIKGFRFLFGRLQAIAEARGTSIPNAVFPSLLEAVELAISVGLGALLTEEAERDRREASKRDEKYETARELVRSVQIDPSDLAKVA